MHDSRNYTVENVFINCSFDLAWDFLIDPINQKEWAIHFYKGVQKVGDQYIASLPFGDVPLRIGNDKETGSIDLFLGDGGPVHSKLIKGSDNSCLYIFILFQPQQMPDIAWEQEGVSNLKKELQLLKTILEKKARIA